MRVISCWPRCLRGCGVGTIRLNGCGTPAACLMSALLQPAQHLTHQPPALPRNTDNEAFRSSCAGQWSCQPQGYFLARGDSGIGSAAIIGVGRFQSKPLPNLGQKTLTYKLRASAEETLVNVYNVCEILLYCSGDIGKLRQ